MSSHPILHKIAPASPLLALAAACSTTPIRLGLVTALLAVIAPTQTWQQAQPATHPPARHGHSMTFDTVRNVTLMFGGLSYYFHDDTWTWNGTDWLQPAIGQAPSARRNAGMACDSGRQRIVLFGGLANGPYLNDTWEWDGASWLQRAPVHMPPARSSMMMVHDAARAQTLLFSGAMPGNSNWTDTWTWDGDDWTQLAPAHSPVGRRAGSIAYDSSRARCVIFGGLDDSFQDLGDTWEWDGTDWAQQATAHAPSPRRGVGLTYDAGNGRVVLFGGFSQQRHGDVWEYDGQDWALQSPLLGPSPRTAPMVYDAARDNVVLFGGTTATTNEVDETWLYTHDVGTATFTPFGHGCLGSVGTPQLALAGGMPIIGTTVQVACTSLQPDHFATMWIGFSHSNSGLGNLPFDLTALGMPGCTLFVSGDLVALLLNWNGTALWQTTLPNAPEFVGLPFYLQAAVIDRVNALGMVVTNAAELRIGDR